VLPDRAAPARPSVEGALIRPDALVPTFSRAVQELLPVAVTELWLRTVLRVETPSRIAMPEWRLLTPRA
jgi:hypothetical protein